MRLDLRSIYTTSFRRRLALIVDEANLFGRWQCATGKTGHDAYGDGCEESCAIICDGSGKTGSDVKDCRAEWWAVGGGGGSDASPAKPEDRYVLRVLGRPVRPRAGGRQLSLANNCACSSQRAWAQLSSVRGEPPSTDRYQRVPRGTGGHEGWWPNFRRFTQRYAKTAKAVVSGGYERGTWPPWCLKPSHNAKTKRSNRKEERMHGAKV